MSQARTIQELEAARERCRRLALATPQPLRADYRSDAAWIEACIARESVLQGYWSEYSRLNQAIAAAREATQSS
jgi:hypothetical protein